MSASGSLLRLVGVGGSAWGALLLARGDEVWRRVEGRSPDPVEELGIRALGARHLLQGLAQVLAPRATRRVSVAVDVTHAVTMGVLAAGSPSRRRAAALTGGVALLGGMLDRAARPR
ncbi:hypothetical protein [Phycicoccus sp.]|uniref:hypothetical protein n=1 Tax=Phycicoccus sp. TaxID=1902410 RepID=UPI002CE127A6|nr:hypothetical protein [Phycicoccus sp.]HMM94960.1 hypothetical protein [Phycicoccus sp.]